MLVPSLEYMFSVYYISSGGLVGFKNFTLLRRLLLCGPPTQSSSPTLKGDKRVTTIFQQMATKPHPAKVHNHVTHSSLCNQSVDISPDHLMKGKK